MSQRGPRGRGKPRWSVAGGGQPEVTASGAAPASAMAMVGAGPPLAARGASSGLAMITPDVQLGSFGSEAFARFGNWMLKPPSTRRVEQLWAMFHGLPPFSARLLATMVP